MIGLSEEDHNIIEQDLSKCEIDKEDLFGSDRKDRSYSIGFLPPELSTAFGMYMRGDTLSNIGKTLLAGNGIRATARITGTSKCTVTKLYRILIATLYKSGGEDILCKCGQPIIHRGFCKYTYTKSPKRQAFMKKWHEKQKNERR